MAEEGRPKTPAEIDLNHLLQQGHLDISIKPAENEDDARVRRTRDIATFWVAVSMVAIVFLACLGALLFAHPSVDEQRWLQSAVTLILGAAVGAAFKK